MIVYWKNILNKGCDITIYDFDGPRLSNNEVCCLQVTKELLIQKINDTQHPFGHGYIIAAILLDILPNEYCM